MAAPNLTRVRKAYEQVADQLRSQILTGALAAGQRLPRELELAEQMGVSRPTVREALRLLASENLIRTTKGATGGSFVMRPTVDHMSEFLTVNLNLLAAAEEISLDDLLEARACVEVPAAGLAAARRNDDDLQALHASIPADEAELDIEGEFALNRGFHATLVEATDNKLLLVSAQPIFVVLQTHLKRTVITPGDHAVIHAGHARLAEAIAAGDAARAEDEMRHHLEDLRPLYERAWQAAHRRVNRRERAALSRA